MVLNVNDFQISIDTFTQLHTWQLPLECLIDITHLTYPNRNLNFHLQILLFPHCSGQKSKTNLYLTESSLLKMNPLYVKLYMDWCIFNVSTTAILIQTNIIPYLMNLELLLYNFLPSFFPIFRTVSIVIFFLIKHFFFNFL